MALPVLPNQMNEYFANAYNSGRIENLANLFETQAKSVTIDGTVLAGIENIKKDLEKLLLFGGIMTSINKYAVEFENIALLRADWTIETANKNNEPITIKGSSTEIIRKQEDGTWLYIIDHPFGANFIK